MGLTRSNNNGSGNFDIPPETDQLKRLEGWKADPTLFTSGVQSGFDTRRRNIEEGLSPYSGVTNPYARNRMRDVELREAEGDRVAALADQDLAYQGLELQKRTAAAQLRQPQRKQQNGGGWLGSLISAGATIGAAALSDERMKENLQPASPVLPRLENVNLYNYQWKGDGSQDTGVIAQEMANAFPEAVVPGNDQQPWMVKPKTEAEIALQGVKELNQKYNALMAILGK